MDGAEDAMMEVSEEEATVVEDGTTFVVAPLQTDTIVATVVDTIEIGTNVVVAVGIDMREMSEEEAGTDRLLVVTVADPPVVMVAAAVLALAHLEVPTDPEVPQGEPTKNVIEGATMMTGMAVVDGILITTGDGEARKEDMAAHRHLV